jgi:deoxyadenosine/deoxycytidine kinase
MRISIEANIGAGKTTLIRRLQNFYGDAVPIHLEPVEEWGEWLELFYTNQSRWGFTFNLNALMSFMRIQDQNNTPIIVERSPLTCFNVFAGLQEKQGKMTMLEYTLFKDIHDRIAWAPDVIVYLRTDPINCQERMIKRGRDQERSVGLDYLQAIHEQHETLISNLIKEPTAFCKNKRPHVIVIDGNNDENTVFHDVIKELYFTM